MIPVAKVKLIVDTYKTLEKELASANIDKKDFVKKSKEYSSIRDFIKDARGYIGFENEKQELENITNNIIDSLKILLDKKLELFSSTVNNK